MSTVESESTQEGERRSTCTRSSQREGGERARRCLRGGFRIVARNKKNMVERVQASETETRCLRGDFRISPSTTSRCIDATGSRQWPFISHVSQNTRCPRAPTAHRFLSSSSGSWNFGREAAACHVAPTCLVGTAISATRHPRGLRDIHGEAVRLSRGASHSREINTASFMEPITKYHAGRRGTEKCEKVQ